MVSLWGLEKANLPKSALVHASVATALHSLSGSIAYRIVSNLFGFVWFGLVFMASKLLLITWLKGISMYPNKMNLHVSCKISRHKMGTLARNRFLLNHFQPIFFFCTPWKQKTSRFLIFFRGYRSGTLVENGLNKFWEI